MEKTLVILNEMVCERVLEQYALGGALALLFYTEPAVTYDMDVFCLLPGTTSGLVTLAPLYDWLQRRGFLEHREHVLIEGLPVQFIPAYNALVTEAVQAAIEKSFAGVPVRVLRPEHLLAIMVQTGRPKDCLRALQLHEDVLLDQALLEQVLARHGLAQRWHNLRNQGHA